MLTFLKFISKRAVNKKNKIIVILYIDLITQMLFMKIL